ncbi:MAG TPA: hypothetical protein VD970_00445 [Acetobacteraceae bacterium]|nr:hypothetical protein [Acetobacteraceae bacterium]
MRRIRLLTSAALGAALLAGFSTTAGAQKLVDDPGSGMPYRYEAPPGVPRTPHGMGGQGAIGPVEQQNAVAAEAAGSAWRDAGSLLRDADMAVAQGRMTLANELLERAETRMLHRSVEATQLGIPIQGGAVGAIAEARQAVIIGDRFEARRRIAAAHDMLNQEATIMVDRGTAAMQGGSTTVIVPGGSGGQTTIIVPR